ncbi:MAG: Hpt domain-containing protein [Bacteroidales bacterium]
MMNLRKVIDNEAFQENLGVFDEETIAEIIDIFIQEYPQRIQNLQQSIQKGDAEAILFQAHSLKGVIANFGAPHPYMHIRKLEELAKQADINEIRSQYLVFAPLGEQLINELTEIRRNLSV